MKRKGQSEGIIATFVILFVLCFVGIVLCVDKVPATKIGVMDKMGVVKGGMDSGIKWTGMFVKVHDYSKRLRTETVQLEGLNYAPDKTGQKVYATIEVNYKIIPTHEAVISLYKNVGKDKHIAEKLILNGIVKEGFKQATADFDALEIINDRQAVKELAKENIRKNFPAEYFTIENIVISNIGFSSEFEAELDKKKVAEQAAITAENQLEVVKFEQQQEIEKYKAEAEKLRLQKTEVTELMNQLKWIEAWNGILPTTLIMNGEEGSNMILQLPESTVN